MSGLNETRHRKRGCSSSRQVEPGSSRIIAAARRRQRVSRASSRVSPATPRDAAPHRCDEVIAIRVYRTIIRPVPDYKGMAGRNRGSRPAITLERGSNTTFTRKFAGYLRARSSRTWVFNERKVKSRDIASAPTWRLVGADQK